MLVSLKTNWQLLLATEVEIPLCDYDTLIQASSQITAHSNLHDPRLWLRQQDM